MSTSVAYLVNIGVSPRDIGPMLTEYPQILGMRVGTVIKPFVDYLMNLGFPKQVIARMIEKRPGILGYDLEESIKSNVGLLLSVGVRQEALASVIAQYPEILGLSLKPKLDSQQRFLKSNAKIGPEDFGKLLEKMPQVVKLTPAELLGSSNCSDKKFEEKLEDFDNEIEETGPSFSMGGALQLPGGGNDSEEEFEDSDEEMMSISTGS
ncbi:hypothetical protein KI387_027975, partial [Taxus chinensis]